MDGAARDDVVPRIEDVPPFLRAALERFRDGLCDVFHERLAFVRLYGSWARGTPRVGSDVDVVVGIDGCTPGDVRLAARVESRVVIETGLPLSVQVLGVEEYRMLVEREVGWALNVEREGIAV